MLPAAEPRPGVGAVGHGGDDAKLVLEALPDRRRDLAVPLRGSRKRQLPQETVRVAGAFR